jgi:hypothetical protein
VYEGKHDLPVGTARAVSELERGEFPEPFQSKYMTLKDDEDKWAHGANDFFNDALPPDASYSKGLGKGQESGKMAQFLSTHNKEGQVLDKRVAQLKAEAKRLGYI